MKIIGFEPLLDSIDEAYVNYFKKSRKYKLVLFNKPRWKEKKSFKIIHMIIFMIKTFFSLVRKKYDLVHINGANFGIIVYLASFFGCKYVYTIHGAPHIDLEKKEGRQKAICAYIHNILMPIVVSRAEQVYTISKFSQKELWNKYKIKTTVIYNGINRESLKYTEEHNEIIDRIKSNLIGKKVFIFVGRMIDCKNPLRIIDIIEQIKKKDEEIFLIMIGSGVLLNTVKKYANEKKLRNNILFIENVKFEDMPKWYSVSDYFISACDKEGFGLAALEAISCGCIPILPKSGAFRELYNEKFLYDIDKINNITLPIRNSEDDKFFTNLLIKLDWNNIIKIYENEYDKYIN